MSSSMPDCLRQIGEGQAALIEARIMGTPGHSESAGAYLTLAIEACRLARRALEYEQAVQTYQLQGRHVA